MTFAYCVIVFLFVLWYNIGTAELAEYWIGEKYETESRGKYQKKTT